MQTESKILFKPSRYVYHWIDAGVMYNLVGTLVYMRL